MAHWKIWRAALCPPAPPPALPALLLPACYCPLRLPATARLLAFPHACPPTCLLPPACVWLLPATARLLLPACLPACYRPPA